jgi:hypothetical protein
MAAAQRLVGGGTLSAPTFYVDDEIFSARIGYATSKK